MMRYNMEHVKLITSFKEGKFDESSEHFLNVLHQMNQQIETTNIHHTHIMDELEKIKHELEIMKKGFPSEDPRGHRAYHEKMMREQDASTRLREQIMREVIQKGILIGISLIIGALGLKFGFNFMGI